MLKLYDSSNKRLVLIKEEASPKFWENHWERCRPKYTNKNKFIEKYLNRHLNDKEGLILEAGCGIGDKVYYTHHNGYKVVGIDYAKNTIRRTKRKHPELKLVLGDINYLPFKSNVYKCIWCLGVIEHFYNGFDQAVIEMYRILQRGGVLLLSFPVISPIRKIKIIIQLYPHVHFKYKKNNFYQYIYTEKFIKNKAEDHGFKLVQKSKYDGVKGLKDELCFLKYFLQKIYDSQNLAIRIVKFILNFIIGPIAGHMSLMVFKKL